MHAFVAPERDVTLTIMNNVNRYSTYAASKDAANKNGGFNQSQLLKIELMKKWGIFIAQLTVKTNVKIKTNTYSSKMLNVELILYTVLRWRRKKEFHHFIVAFFFFHWISLTAKEIFVSLSLVCYKFRDFLQNEYPQTSADLVSTLFCFALQHSGNVCIL